MFTQYPNNPACKVVTGLSDWCPEVRIAHTPYQSSPPEIPVYPVVADNIRYQFIYKIIGRHSRKEVITSGNAIFQMMNDHSIEKLVFTAESRVKRTNRITGRL
jgi:hypothetical protein